MEVPYSHRAKKKLRAPELPAHVVGLQLSPWNKPVLGAQNLPRRPMGCGWGLADSHVRLQRPRSHPEGPDRSQVLQEHAVLWLRSLHGALSKNLSQHSFGEGAGRELALSSIASSIASKLKRYLAKRVSEQVVYSITSG